jgi:plastin-1
MSSLRDPSLKSGLFFADLVSSIWLDTIDVSKVSQGVDYDEQLDNARYILAIVRAKGVLVFISAEDLVAGGIKMLLGFLASLWEAELKESHPDEKKL